MRGQEQRETTIEDSITNRLPAIQPTEQPASKWLCPPLGRLVAEVVALVLLPMTRLAC